MDADDTQSVRALADLLSERCFALSERARDEGDVMLWMVLHAASFSISDALDMLADVEADDE